MLQESSTRKCRTRTDYRVIRARNHELQGEYITCLPQQFYIDPECTKSIKLSKDSWPRLCSGELRTAPNSPNRSCWLLVDALPRAVTDLPKLPSRAITYLKLSDKKKRMEANWFFS
mmetsp:Transcript_7722/g.22932  ORF Transcript_7722/g.22932 Transcript_7722/m.22932 type:complete len:116 (-) Transcript_7722:1316-1663(-)